MAAGESAPNGETAPAEEPVGGASAEEPGSGGSDTGAEESAPGEGSASGEEPAEATEEPAGGGGSASGQSPRQLADAGAEALTEAAFRTGDFGPARELLQQARDEAVAAGDKATEALATERLGMLAHYQNITKLIAGTEVPGADADAEEKLFRQALSIWEELGDQAGTARSVFGLGLVFQVLHGEWPAAMPYFWQALEGSGALEERGEAYARSEIHRHVGFYYHVEQVSAGEAVRHLQISLDLREEHGDPRLVPSALVALGEAELAAGNSQRAIELLTRAVADARAAGLLQHRIEDAERALGEAQAAPPAQT
jgi:tetratricopeptide (TPR) repeat protein